MKRAALLASFVLFSCTRAVVPSEGEQAISKDCDDQLVLAVPDLPLDLQAAPRGGVLVVDRGGLELRSEQQFDVVRHLAPGIDGWYQGAFEHDGGSWRGETFDGQRYEVDVETGRATRQYDARLSRDERELREKSFDPDPEHAFEENTRIASANVKAALEQSAVPVEAVPELEATAALRDGDTLILADLTGTLWRIDLEKKKVEATVACPMCSPKVAFVRSADGYVALDRVGNAIELSPLLVAQREAGLRPELPGNEDALMVTRALSVDGGKKVAWLSSDGQHGLFDLAAFAPIRHERPVGLHGVTSVALWGVDRVAYTSNGVVEARAIPSGKIVLRKAGNYSALEVTPQGALKAKRADGSSMTFEGPASEAQRPSYSLEREASADGGYDLVRLRRGTEALIVSDQTVGPGRLAELHRAARYDASATAYALAGGTGRLEVYCAPKKALASKVPARVPVPDVADIDGVKEIALRELPERYESLAAEPDGAAFILASDADGKRALGRVAPDGTHAELIALPSAAEFARLMVSGDGSLWALAPSEFAQRKTDGTWRTVAVGLAGEFKQVVALTNGEIAAALEDRAGKKRLIVTGKDGAFLKELPFARELPPLIALPDGGLLVPADPRCGKDACERGFIVRDGKVDARAPLIAAISERKPLNGWLRDGKIFVLGQRWAALDAQTGKVLEDLSPQLVFKKRKHPVGPRPAPTPYLDSLEVELIRFVDQKGRPLALAALRGPAWIPEIAQAYDAVDTEKGTWARKGTLSVMFWDGKALSAWFHPATRESRIAEMQ